jgi:hypothetical protein
MAQDKARPTRARKPKQEPTEVAPAKAKAKAKPRAAGSRKRAKSTPAQESVAFHAYLLWEQGEPGGPLDHWLRAESELLAA